MLSESNVGVGKPIIGVNRKRGNLISLTRQLTS